MPGTTRAGKCGLRLTHKEPIPGKAMMRARPVAGLLLIGGLLAGAPASAGDTDSEAAAIERLRSNLADRQPRLQIDAIRATPVPGIYEVASGPNLYYLTPDARYLLRGELIDLKAGRNLTQARQGAKAHEVVSQLDPGRMVTLEPAQRPATRHVTVFTDPSCPYCRRLHEELLAIVEDYPVQVRYAMFPRAGPDSDAAEKLRDVWCADDPVTALTRAKAGQSVPARADDCEAPLEQHWQAAQKIGVSGTPYLVIGDDGPVVPGYRPRKKLLSLLGLEPQGQ
jgi:thiol:disulfide interchange protein DsbC